MNNAFDSVKESYDIETLREIRDHGCRSGVAHDHIYYRDTIKFFDTYEDEIVEYIAEAFGDEFNEELWNDNPCNITGYKNDATWCYIEMVASVIVDQYEDITQEELSDSDGPKHIVDPSSGEVIFEGDPSYNELSTNTYEADLEDGNVHDVTNAIGMNSLSTNTYEDIKELASTPWGQDHLQIISA
jgi:hypothetical protein